MLVLVIAGEIVFGLAFNVPRFFRPTMLEVFGITNTQLGDMFAVYGVAAMLAYYPGGAVADHFSARALIVVSLLSTALGGVYMATIPDAFAMKFLYGYWGITTIFLFWGALIRATRDWGGDKSQGLAFGILEGGRGLVAASVALIGVYILAFHLPDNARLATAAEREAGFRTIVLFYSLLTFLAGIFSWYAIPQEKRASDVEFNPLKGMGIVLRRPIIWAQAGIIVCAYCGYKGLDNYSLVSWSVASPSGSGMAIIYANFFTTYFAVYALRGIYFALLEENRTPMFLTGAAVGLISLVGYTPDIFFGPITGRILDANPGPIGFQNYFMFLASIAVVGLLMVAWLIWLRRHGGEKLWQQVEKSTK